MGKRVPPDEKPFNPVEAALVRSVLAPDPPLPEPLPVSTQPAIQPPPKREQATVLADIETEQRLLRGIQSTPRSPEPNKLSREKRVLLTQAEERETERLVNRLASELSTPLKLSHLLRACVTLLRHAEDQIADQARQVAPLTRPSNGDPVALAQFEFRLAQILSAAFRDAVRLR